MTKQQFNKEVNRIFKQYNVVDNHIDTPFGLMYVRAEKTDNQKLYSVYMRFKEDFDIEMFFKYFSRHESINSHSKKWNIHNQDADYVLNELEERLDNLQYILEQDGKVAEKGLKPVLTECNNL